MVTVRYLADWIAKISSPRAEKDSSTLKTKYTDVISYTMCQSEWANFVLKLSMATVITKTRASSWGVS